MRHKVIVYNKVDSTVIEYLKKTCEVVYFQQNEQLLNNPLFLKELSEAHAILGSRMSVNSSFLDLAPRLKIVSNISVGYDNFDMNEITKRGIMATNTPTVLNETVADTIFALILATARRIPEMDQNVKSGKWVKSNIDEEWFGVDVHHKTLGIIGLGGIGSSLAKRAHFGFDMKILYHNRSRNEEAERLYNATYCSMDKLLHNSDFVCVMVPLTKHTEKLIGKRELSMMKKSGILINASRGKVIDEEALIESLQQKEIFGAGLDVFTQEPVANDNPLLSMKNVVTLPHIGSATKETRLKMQLLAAENVVEGLMGGTPKNLINSEIVLNNR